MKSVTVIGFGWLGKACATYLHSKKYPVKVTNRSASLTDLDFPIYAWKLGDDFPAQAASEVVVIAIAEKENILSNYTKLYSDLEKLRVKQIVFISSTSIYHSIVGEATENSEIILSESNYNVAMKEFTLKETHIKSVVLRLAGLVGPNRNPARFLSGKSNVPNPSNKINLVHQMDVIRFVEACILNNAEGVYNICASEHPIRKDFYTEICKMQNLKAPEFAIDSEPTRWIDNRKSKEDFNFKYHFDDLLMYYQRSVDNA